MQEYKKEFIEFMVESGVLCFGDFTLKSGRRAPYFVNTGKYRTGKQIAKLGEYYAAAYLEHGVNADVLFGPAYKGIPLSVATSIALADRHGVDLGFCFDRKEAKDHGEGGTFVGTQLKDGDKIAIVEDVMTSGKALREVLPKLKGAADVKVEAVILSVDRMEKSLSGGKSAVQDIYDEFGIKVYAIVTIKDVIEALETGAVAGKEYLQAMKDYLAEYGA